VFATETIPKGTVVERSPVIIIEDKHEETVAKMPLQLYLFEFGKHQAIALGVGSLFNHSTKFNVDYKTNLKKKMIDFKAVRNIRKGSQLFIDYGYDMKYARNFLRKL